MDHTGNSLASKGARARIEREWGKPLPTLLAEWYYGRGWRQLDIADRVGVDQSTVSRWFRAYGLTARQPHWMIPDQGMPVVIRHKSASPTTAEVES